jgi:pSer/pThr/pTyr-binding forkhead associated (FHA) protein
MSDTDQTRMMGVTGMPAGGVTVQVPAGPFDPMRTQMGGTTTCPVCKMSTPLAEPYCMDCGFLLSSTPGEGGGPVVDEQVVELVDIQNGQRFRLRSGINSLGRQGTDILVAEGTVSRVHARLTVENNRVIVEDLGSTNGTKVGEMRIGPHEPTPAAPGTTLRFGSWRVRLEFAGGDAPAAAPPADRTMMAPPPVPALLGELGESAAESEAASAQAPPAPVAETSSKRAWQDSPDVLAVLQALDSGVEDIPITVGTMTVGRRSENVIALRHDAYVSSRHAEIFTDNTGTYLSDLGSTNGTLYNGEKVLPFERQLLLEGDEVQFGRTRYRFQLVGAEDMLEGDMGEADELADKERPE